MVDAESGNGSKLRTSVQWIGLALGPLLALATLMVLPTSYEVVVQPADAAELLAEVGPTETGAVSTIAKPFTWAGRATLAVMVWMGVWWLTEAIEISATALLPLVVFPLMQIDTIADAAAPYAKDLIFLYLGGFIIAFSMQKWGLGKRLALLTLKVVGTSTSAMIFGFMLVTAVLSAFVSNTATTAMMLPIALSVVALFRKQAEDSEAVSPEMVGRFSTCLLLAIAYSASIGGITTIIGTPTNAFLITFIKEQIAAPYRRDFSFVSWLPIGLSFSAVFLPVMYLMMTRFIFPIGNLSITGGKQLIARELKQLGGVHRGEWNTMAVFAVVVSLWLFRPLITKIEFTIGGDTVQPFSLLTDSVIAMFGAVALFIIPVNARKRVFTMDWATAEKLPWGILLLFGGGLSLAGAVKRNGVAEFIGSQAELFSSVPTIVMVLAVTATIVFMTELTSNAATTASLVPVLAALSPGLGIHPYQLIIPATIASSCAFMLPVATPPNAIVFGSGLITGPQMARSGFLLNLVAVVLVTLHALLVVGPMLAK